MNRKYVNNLKRRVIKIGKMKRIIGFVLFIGCLLPTVLLAQDDPTLRASAKQQVMVGERFQVVFEANAEGKHFTAPSFEGFDVMGGPFTSSSSSVQYVNGSVSRSVKNTYTYALQASKEGTFRIGSASLTVKGNKITSEPIEIKVVPDDGSHAAPTGGGNNRTQGEAQSSNEPQVSGKDLFLKVTASKKTVYVGEQIVLTYKLYTRVPVSSPSIERIPSYAGFWTKDITDNNGGWLRQSSEYVNGIEYTTAEIQRVIIVPQRSGNLILDPMTIECVAQIRTQSNNRQSNDPFDIFFNDPFFNRNITNVHKELSSNSLALEVKSLPDNGKPASFAGAVGNFNFKSDIDKTQLKTNEAFTLTLTVSGTGNIELLQMPEPVFPPDFEVYDPKITTSANNTVNGMSGTKKAEYLVIPRRAGTFDINPVEFSFFNIGNGNYATLTSEGYTIEVEKGTADESHESSVYTTNQEGIKYLGSDIRHISTGNPRLKPTHSVFFATTLYFIILAALLLVFFVLLTVLKKRDQLRQDNAVNRNRKADKVARGRLKKANQYLKSKDQDNFYVELSQALWGYIADKLSIERSKLSMDTVSETMQGKNVPADLTQQFIDTLSACEFARFAPGSAEEKMDDLYSRGLDVITKAEKVL